VFGMAVAGFDDGGSPVAANDLHLLFVPLFSAYGLAFLLVLWNRREVRIPYLRTVFIGLIFFVSAIPLINFRTASLKLPFWWPPYAPPAVARLNKWVEPNEIILSDMPWAVAWYANRKSFWIPEKLRDFIEIHDYARLQQPFAGLFLTPITGNAAFMGEVLKGEYKEWAPLILRSSNVPGFPFKQIRPMEIKGENVFFSDRNRWLHEGEVDEELMPAEEQKDGKKNKEEGTEEAKPETKAEEKAEEKPENKAEEVKDSPAEQPGAAQ